ncbi:phage holin family protein [Sphingomonas sp. PB4P5]|uniref:phage holin family protein n=1 Tax=Parasphingomonas puruogangriensis TaxID=3096155 RepID=UPI002FC71A32
MPTTTKRDAAAAGLDMVTQPPPEESIGTLVGNVVEDGRAYALAELAIYRAKAMAWLGQAKFVALFGVSALLLANCAIIALFVGLLLTLAPRVGPGWATMIVVGGTLAFAGLLGWLALRHIRKMGAAK